MRQQEWKYFLGCYGLSFIPALTYLFVRTKDRGRVYGPALVSLKTRSGFPTEKKLHADIHELWCWVSPEWNFLRIATLYGVVW